MIILKIKKYNLSNIYVFKISKPYSIRFYKSFILIKLNNNLNIVYIIAYTK